MWALKPFSPKKDLLINSPWGERLGLQVCRSHSPSKYLFSDFPHQILATLAATILTFVQVPPFSHQPRHPCKPAISSVVVHSTEPKCAVQTHSWMLLSRTQYLPHSSILLSPHKLQLLYNYLLR